MHLPAEKSVVAGDEPPLQGWEAASRPDPSSFAGTLAALASPTKKFGVSSEGVSSQGWKSASAWSFDELAEDVATLSYERALRAHARYRPADPFIADPPASDPPNNPNDRINQALSADAAPDVQTAAPQGPSLLSAEAEPETAQDLTTALDRNLKRSSITIRLSKAENAQLRKRAAEAGLTVSAYLRSCTVEVESLRALVKNTLAQLRSDPSMENQTPSTPVRSTRLQWLAHLWPHPRIRQSSARA